MHFPTHLTPYLHWHGACCCFCLHAGRLSCQRARRYQGCETRFVAPGRSLRDAHSTAAAALGLNVAGAQLALFLCVPPAAAAQRLAAFLQQ